MSRVVLVSNRVVDLNNAVQAGGVAVALKRPAQELGRLGVQPVQLDGQIVGQVSDQVGGQVKSRVGRFPVRSHD